MLDQGEPIPGATPKEAADAAAAADIRVQLEQVHAGNTLTKPGDLDKVFAGVKVDTGNADTTLSADPSKIQPTNLEGWQTVDTSVGKESVDEPLPPVTWNTDRNHKSYESDISQPAPERLDGDILESIAGGVASSAETRLTGIDGELLNTEAADAALKSLELEREEKVERLLLETASGKNITKEAAMAALLLDTLLKQLKEANLDYTKDTIKTKIPSIRENPLRKLGRNLKQGLIDAVILLQNKRNLRQTIDSNPTATEPETTPPPPKPTQN